MNFIKKCNQCRKNISCSMCDSNELCKEWTRLVERHIYWPNKKDKPYKFISKKKSYAHFDLRVSLGDSSIQNYVMDPEKISKHSFYPFIHFEKKISRFGKKGPKKPRDLYYASHLDRCVYQRYAFLLNYEYNLWTHENGLDNVAIAYRNNLKKNNIHFAKDAFDAIKSFPQCFILVGDFTSFFDNLDHKYLKKMICKLLKVDYLSSDYYAVFKNITSFASWNWKDIVQASGEDISKRGIRRKINRKPRILTPEQFKKHKADIKKNKSGKGIPQGSPISAVLSNIYMMEFDQRIHNFVKENNGIYMRYSDDFLIVLPYEQESKIEQYITFLSSFIESMNGLVKLQEEKTSYFIYKNQKIHKYDNHSKKINYNQISQLNYLGFLFNGIDIKLRPAGITKYYYRMYRKARAIVSSNWTSPFGKHIFPRVLYKTYSYDRTKKKIFPQNFIGYVRRAKAILELNDPEAEALLKRHRGRIGRALKK